MDSATKERLQTLLAKEKSIKKEIDQTTQKDYESMVRKSQLLNDQYKILLDIMSLLIDEGIEPITDDIK